MARRGRPPLNTLPPEPEFPELIAYWNKALSSAHGIAISSNKPNTLLQKLYRARRECGHTAYHGLKLIECENEVQIRPRED